MAARRITQSSINWTAIAERVPPTQKTSYIAFKTKSDNYLRRMLANPEQPPKLDWGFYKSRVAIAGMVDTFQKQYDALKVPYPEDKWSNLVEVQRKEVVTEIDKFCKESNDRASKYEAEIAKIRAMIPYDQMTMEDFRDAHPELAIDPINRPTFWPHTPEDQPDYKPTSEFPQSSH